MATTKRESQRELRRQPEAAPEPSWPRPEGGEMRKLVLRDYAESLIGDSLPDDLCLLVLDPEDFAQDAGPDYLYTAPVLLGEPLAGGRGLDVEFEPPARVLVGQWTRIPAAWLDFTEFAGKLASSQWEAVRRAVRGERVRSLLVGREAEHVWAGAQGLGASMIEDCASLMRKLASNVPFSAESRVVLELGGLAPDSPERGQQAVVLRGTGRDIEVEVSQGPSTTPGKSLLYVEIKLACAEGFDDVLVPVWLRRPRRPDESFILRMTGRGQVMAAIASRDDEAADGRLEIGPPWRAIAQG